ncbi:hypothetical protein [Sphingobium yanoikuyae]|uniref:hypothetical protein n=1 Tax=Sphingobium yanoikuyae TaxID=13690 RepID=UPI0035B2C3FD
MDDVIALDRRISNQIDKGRGIRFSQEELDLLVLIGAIDVVKAAATEAMKKRAEARHQEREARMAEREGFGPRARISRQATEAEIEAASRRARRAFGGRDK